MGDNLGCDKLPLLSIIVPVYNVEKYLTRCIDSIINQTYTNLEIILVDDGSPDASGELCDEYSLKDKRIKVIHQENKGLAGARNSGIKVANGDYIAFVDSDDWIAENMYEEMIHTAVQHDADIVKCGFERTDGNKSIDIACYSDNKVLADDIMNLYFESVLWITVCNAIFKKVLTKKILFPQGFIAEDNYASFFFLWYSNKVAMLNKPYYKYFVNPNSITGNKKELWSKTRMKINTEILKKVDKLKICLPINIEKKMHMILAKDWFHYIRDDKTVLTIDDDIRAFIIKNLNIRRKIQLMVILFFRKYF